MINEEIARLEEALEKLKEMAKITSRPDFLWDIGEEIYEIESELEKLKNASQAV